MGVSESFRPQLHFSPDIGWMNDPNGLIRVDGIHHLFFQHNPDSTLHGPMHWGHATSTDLVRWQERPIALFPSDLGMCFSGSAVETSGGQIKLLFTGQRLTPDGKDLQTQCLVHADRAVERFALETGNPVLDNPDLEVFRDPKVIWHAPTQRWIMLVTHGQCIGFYGSSDLVRWTYLSSFGEAEGRHGSGPWECPDLVMLAGVDGASYWALVVGIADDAYAHGSGTQYFVGRFDGVRFTNLNPPTTELWLDHGRDYYAAQSFFGIDREAPTTIAWASNWDYARQTPTRAFRGVMSLPRELRLVKTPDGLRIAQRVPEAVQRRFVELAQGQEPDRSSGTYVFETTANLAIGQELTIALFGEGEAQFVVNRSGPDRGRIRTVRRGLDWLDHFAHDYWVDLPWPPAGGLDLKVYVDRGVVELSAASGLVWITNLFYPQHPEGAVVITTRQATALEQA